MSEPAMPILDVRNLTTRFMVNGAWKTVIRHIGFSVHAGETLAIVGESGSGKSVTSLSIMGLLSPGKSQTSGQIKLKNQDITGLSTQQRRLLRANQMAMIFQEPMTSLNPSLTIGQQIAELFIVHRKMNRHQAKERAIELLKKVQIANPERRFDEYPHQFSGGMRQRVMIAMALALEPALLIADEPTTALDVTIQGQILDLIKQLQAESHMAVLFITHDMGVVAEIADRTLVMYQGEMVETGPTTEIFQSPKAAYTRALLNAVPKLGSMNQHRWPCKFPTIDLQSGQERPEDQTSVHQVDSQSKPILSVKDLTTLFDIYGGFWHRRQGAVHAVENISFDVYPGETLSLVGESGCGKSTTGRSIIRLVDPLRGEITFNGQNIRQLDSHQLRQIRRDIQFIFQDPFASLNPRMTVAESLIEPLLEHQLANKKQALDKAVNMLLQVGLSEEMLKRYPHEFSGGQRQRICIARALMLDPKLIIADESVSALDVSVKAQIINLLMDLQQKLNLAYLFISHDMAVVERISHRVAVMYLGEIVEIGPRQAIFNAPQHHYTQKLLSAVPVADPTQRNDHRKLSTQELKSPIRPLNFHPPKRHYREVSSEHWVML